MRRRLRQARTVLALACLSAFPLIAGLTGCAGDRSGQGADPRMEDSRTAGRVRESLAAGADYKYDGVQVAAIKGVVQLSGFVLTSAQKNAAGVVASKVAGAKGVVNNITVKD
jgi:hyperosmotically inducible periplasmic protein